MTKDIRFGDRVRILSGPWAGDEGTYFEDREGLKPPAYGSADQRRRGICYESGSMGAGSQGCISLLGGEFTAQLFESADSYDFAPKLDAGKFRRNRVHSHHDMGCSVCLKFQLGVFFS